MENAIPEVYIVTSTTKSDNVLPIMLRNFCEAHKYAVSMIETDWVLSVYITPAFFNTVIDLQSAKELAIFSMERD